MKVNMGGDRNHRYESLPQELDVLGHAKSDIETPRKVKSWSLPRPEFLATIAFAIMMLSYGIYSGLRPFSKDYSACGGSVQDGYQCQPDISHFWGQYSPFFTVVSEISADVPPTCEITFAQILSRHGARDPTASKTVKYQDTINHLQQHTISKSYKGRYKFLRKYVYNLGADQLSHFGQQQMINSGLKFYSRYETLSKDAIPFVRSSGQERVVESAQNWTQGFHTAKSSDGNASDPGQFPYSIIIIPEGPAYNNTLDHSLCTAFEEGYDSTIGDSARDIWADSFIAPIKKRLNHDLKQASLSSEQIIHLMDMCPFDTVHNPDGAISPFCRLFSKAEWHAYDYYQSLGKFYGFSWGNPLGPTQGVGFTNELVARLTSTAVDDHTSTNSTLDGSTSTFPIGRETKLYADFSHDNDLTSIFSALGLYNATKPLLNTSIESVKQTKGYTASWTVPFAARAYFEKMTCEGSEEEFVRVIVNDRVLPLETCGGDELGRCTLSKFVESLSFARSGGNWDMCFI